MGTETTEPLPRPLGQAQGSLKAGVFKVSLLERPFLFSKFLVI